MSTVLARKTDPFTSWEAAFSVDDVTETQAIILVLLREKPMCDEELFAAYQQGVADGFYLRKTEQGIRSRRAELVSKGLVTSTTTTVMSTGRKAKVWEVTR